MSIILHATCVAIDGRGVLLVGGSGSGKSDLALRLIDRGAELVSDDGTILEARDGTLHAAAPPTIVGQIEARGLGILALPARAGARIALLLALDETVPRMPEEHLPVRTIEAVDIPVLALDPFECSAAIKAEKALALFGLAA